MIEFSTTSLLLCPICLKEQACMEYLLPARLFL